VSAFNPAAWVRRLESLGGYVMLDDGKWMWGVPLDDNLEEVRSLSTEIAPPENALAVRQYVSGRP